MAGYGGAREADLLQPTREATTTAAGVRLGAEVTQGHYTHTRASIDARTYLLVHTWPDGTNVWAFVGMSTVPS